MQDQGQAARSSLRDSALPPPGTAPRGPQQAFFGLLFPFAGDMTSGSSPQAQDFRGSASSIFTSPTLLPLLPQQVYSSGCIWGGGFAFRVSGLPGSVGAPSSDRGGGQPLHVPTVLALHPPQTRLPCRLWKRSIRQRLQRRSEGSPLPRGPCSSCLPSTCCLKGRERVRG